MPKHGWVIAIDGPAGSGKSTTAKAVAEQLGFIYLDTGALYRAITVLALDQDVAVTDGPALVDMIHEAGLRVYREGAEQRVSAGGADLTSRLRSPEVEVAVSPVSAAPEVREAMLDVQRAQRTAPGLVAEGRDLGTVVFPDADLKIYLVADLPVRAYRRALERKVKGEPSDAEAERIALERRDHFDSTRTVAPLRKASDAIEVDTSQVSIDQQVSLVIELFKERSLA